MLTVKLFGQMGATCTVRLMFCPWFRWIFFAVLMTMTLIIFILIIVDWSYDDDDARRLTESEGFIAQMIASAQTFAMQSAVSLTEAVKR
jgi:sensor domain CHASE-containing protein